jgi:hypothetical protein
MRRSHSCWAAYALIIGGVALFAFGLSSCSRYYRDVRTGPPVEDADGDARPYVAFKTFLLSTCGGVVLVASGLYLRKPR